MPPRPVYDSPNDHLQESCSRRRFKYCSYSFYVRILIRSIRHEITSFVRVAALSRSLGSLIRTWLYGWTHTCSLCYQLMPELLPLCHHCFQLRSHFSAAIRLDVIKYPPWTIWTQFQFLIDEKIFEISYFLPDAVHVFRSFSLNFIRNQCWYIWNNWIVTRVYFARSTN